MPKQLSSKCPLGGKIANVRQRNNENGGKKKMPVVSMKQLLEAGVHFGHTTRRWNPKMAKYIYTARNGIYIIDLKKTAEEIERAYQALFEIVSNGGKILFVGTKKQAQEAVEEEAKRTGQFYVNQRWLGGTLTNFHTIRRRIKRLKDLYEMEEKGTFALLPKKEVIGLVKERDRLEKFLSGIKDMQKLPDAIYIVDPKKEINAIREARILKIPVFGIVDTNCDPDDVDYIIPANDDAIRAVKLITHVLGNAIIEAQGGIVERFDEEDDSIDLYEEKEAEKRKPITSYQTPEEKKTEEKPVETKVKPKVEEKPEKPQIEKVEAEPKVEKKLEEHQVEKVEVEPQAEEKEVEPKVEEKLEEPQVEKVEVEPQTEEKEVEPKVEEKLEEPQVEEVEVTLPVTEKEAKPEEVEPEVLVVDYESLRVVELREMAKEKNIPRYSTMRKAELIEALKNN